MPGEFRHRVARVGCACQSHRDRDLRHAGLRPLPRPGFPILETLSRSPHKPLALSHELAANWKLGLQITFDDYHTVAVHPTTFGKSGYPDREKLTYARFGATAL